MTIRLTFELTLRSDYHVGAGQRAGYTVDSALLRNHQGTPVLRGTLLNGLLRDGFADLQDQVTGANVKFSRWEKDNGELLERLLGAPGKRKRWRYRSSRLSLHSPQIDRRWGAQDVARVRIDPRTRRAYPQQLFVQEEGDARLTFRFTATCPGGTERDRQDAAALVAAARLVRHLGSARRRGRGECRLHLVDATGFVVKNNSESWTEAGLKAFKTYWLDEHQMPTQPVDKEQEKIEPIPPEAKRFRVLARLQEPVLIADKSQKANAFETLLMIPGTAVLGSLATHAARILGIDDTPNSNHALFTQLFVRGGIKTTGLLPVYATDSGNLFPSIPAPLSWEQCETNPEFGDDSDSSSHPHHDQLNCRSRKCSKCGAKLKSVGGYLTLKKKIAVQKVHKREEIHIQIERDTGRVNEGDLFTYIMIDGGQWFAGEISCDAASWPHFTRLTGLTPDSKNEMLLGKAIRRGYGLVEIYLQEVVEDTLHIWIPEKVEDRILPKEAEAIKSKDDNVDIELSLLLLADSIVVDAWNRFQQRFDNESLANWFGVEKVQITDQIVKSRRIDSFNTYRQIPGWRDEAIVAGSLVRFTFTIPMNEQDKLLQTIQRLEKNGIGLRTAEGFGQIAINHPLLTDHQMQANLKMDKAYKLLSEHSGGEHKAWLEAEFRRIWANKLDVSQATDKTWTEMKAIDADLARLLFLYQQRPLAELQQWLATKEGTPTKLGYASHLWSKKTFEARTKTVQITPETLKLINKLLVNLKDWSDYAHSAGLEMLAERIGAQVEENEGGVA